MAKIDWIDSREKDEFLHTFILMALTDSGKIDQIMSQEGFDVSNLDVKFSVNGFDLPVEETIERINKGIDKMVEKKTIELLNERFCGLNDLVEEFQDNITEQIKSAFKETEEE